MRRQQKGFTLAELAVVMVLLGSFGLTSMPTVSQLQERSGLASARQEIETAFATARAVAIQKGRAAQIRLSGNALRVTVATSRGGEATVLPLMPLRAVYGVSLVATDTLVTFDAQGVSSLPATGVYRLVGKTRRDSVCVTTRGAIMGRSCS